MIPVFFNHRSVKIDAKRKVEVFQFNDFKLGLVCRQETYELPRFFSSHNTI